MAIRSTQYNLIPAGSSGYSAYIPPVDPGINLTFISDGDANGVIYYIGTNALTVSFANPHGNKTQNLASTLGAGTEAGLTDRANNSMFTNDTPNSWMGIDLGLDVSRTLIPNKYSVKIYNGSGHFIRNWKIQGTNFVISNSVSDWNAATWTDLDTRVGNTLVAANNTYYSFDITGVTTAYRYLRLFQTGVDSNGENYLALAELEFYGTLYL